MIAVLLWFFTYRFVFNRQLVGVPLPGDGTFRYMNPVQPLQTFQLRRSSLISKSEKISTFMGMPLNSSKSGTTLEEGFHPRAAAMSEERSMRQ